MGLFSFFRRSKKTTSDGETSTEVEETQTSTATQQPSSAYDDYSDYDDYDDDYEYDDDYDDDYDYDDYEDEASSQPEPTQQPQMAQTAQPIQSQQSVMTSTQAPQPDVNQYAAPQNSQPVQSPQQPVVSQAPIAAQPAQSQPQMTQTSQPSMQAQTAASQTPTQPTPTQPTQTAQPVQSQQPVASQAPVASQPAQNEVPQYVTPNLDQSQTASQAEPEPDYATYSQARMAETGNLSQASATQSQTSDTPYVDSAAATAPKATSGYDLDYSTENFAQDFSASNVDVPDYTNTLNKAKSDEVSISERLREVIGRRKHLEHQLQTYQQQLMDLQSTYKNVLNQEKQLVNTSISTRQNQIDELSMQIEQAKADYDNRSAKLQPSQEVVGQITSLKSEQSNNQLAMNSIKDKQKSIQAQIDAVNNQIQENAAQQERLKVQKNQILNEVKSETNLQKLISSAEVAKQQSADIDGKLANIQDAIDNLSIPLKDERENYDQNKKYYAQLSNKNEEIKRQLAGINQEIEAERQAHAPEFSALENINHQLEAMRMQKSSLQDGLRQLYDELTTIDKRSRSLNAGKQNLVSYRRQN